VFIDGCELAYGLLPWCKIKGADVVARTPGYAAEISGRKDAVARRRAGVLRASILLILLNSCYWPISIKGNNRNVAVYLIGTSTGRKRF